jgi:hypothetical protein
MSAKYYCRGCGLASGTVVTLVGSEMGGNLTEIKRKSRTTYIIE